MRRCMKVPISALSCTLPIWDCTSYITYSQRCNSSSFNLYTERHSQPLLFKVAYPQEKTPPGDVIFLSSYSFICSSLILTVYSLKFGCSYSNFNCIRYCFFSVFTKFQIIGYFRTSARLSSGYQTMIACGRLSLFFGCGCCELLRLSMYSSLVQKMM